MTLRNKFRALENQVIYPEDEEMQTAFLEPTEPKLPEPKLSFGERIGGYLGAVLVGFYSVRRMFGGDRRE